MLLSKNWPMKNDNSLTSLRSNALINIGILCVILLSNWWIYSVIADTWIQKIKQIESLKIEHDLLINEWVITKKPWDTLTPEEKKNERWQTQTKLVPSLQKMIWIGTPQASKNILKIKDMSQVTQTPYIQWLKASWTDESDATLTKTQEDIAEVIPLFARISEADSTEIISGKITLKTLIDYVQQNIVEKFALWNALGQIGISTVDFPENGDIGIYEVPLRFEWVQNANIMELLKFTKSTGEVRIIDEDNNITLEHKTHNPLKNTVAHSSKLGNLLITVKELIIIPTHKDPNNPEWEITTKSSLWDVHITLLFYIRWASRDHIATLDRDITTLLSKTWWEESLVQLGNAALKRCNNCPEAPYIKDILHLLGNADNAYKSIIAQEKNPKSIFTPIEILEHRTWLLLTLDSLEKKLKKISWIIWQ